MNRRAELKQKARARCRRLNLGTPGPKEADRAEKPLPCTEGLIVPLSLSTYYSGYARSASIGGDIREPILESGGVR